VTVIFRHLRIELCKVIIKILQVRKEKAWVSLLVWRQSRFKEVSAPSCNCTTSLLSSPSYSYYRNSRLYRCLACDGFLEYASSTLCQTCQWWDGLSSEASTAESATYGTYFNIRTYTSSVRTCSTYTHEALRLQVADLQIDWKANVHEVVPDKLGSASWRSMSGLLQMRLGIWPVTVKREQRAVASQAVQWVSVGFHSSFFDSISECRSDKIIRIDLHLPRLLS